MKISSQQKNDILEQPSKPESRGKEPMLFLDEA